MTAENLLPVELELLDVHLLNFPLDVYLRAQERADGLLREFALIAQDRASGGTCMHCPRGCWPSWTS